MIMSIPDVCVFRMTLTVMRTVTLWAASWQNQIQLLWKTAAPTAAFIQATRYTLTHTHIHVRTHARMQTHTHLINSLSSDARWLSSDSDVGADRCSACVTAQWQHDESLQLRGFWSGGGEGPNPILIGLWHPEGGAASQSLSLRGPRFSAEEPLWPVSDGECASCSNNVPYLINQKVSVCAFYRYVKTYLLPDKSSHSKKKTAVRKKTLDPVFDQTLRVRHSFTYCIQWQPSQKSPMSHLSLSSSPSVLQHALQTLNSAVTNTSYQ